MGWVAQVDCMRKRKMHTNFDKEPERKRQLWRTRRKWRDKNTRGIKSWDRKSGFDSPSLWENPVWGLCECGVRREIPVSLVEMGKEYYTGLRKTKDESKVV
jgi:hypothetical protein